MLKPITVLRNASTLKEKGITAICFKNDSELFSSDCQGKVFLWDLRTRRPAVEFQAHEQRLLGMDYERDCSEDARLYTQGRDQILKVWKFNKDSYELLTEFVADAYSFCCFALMGKTILIPRDGRIVLVHDCDYKNSRAYFIEKKDGILMELKFVKHRNVQCAAELYESGKVIFRDSETFQIIRTIQVKHENTLTAFDYYNDVFFFCSVDSYIFKVKIKEDDTESIKSAKFEALTKEGCSKIRVCPVSGKFFAVGCWDGKIRLFQSKDLKPLAILEFHMQQVSMITFNGSQFAVASEDGMITIWRPY